MRCARHAVIEVAGKPRKNGPLSEDDIRRIEKEIQAISDRFIKDLDAHRAQGRGWQVNPRGFLHWNLVQSRVRRH